MSENLNQSLEKKTNTDFEQAKKWLLGQDVGTKDIFRQKLISFLESKKGIVFEETELGKFVKMIEAYKVKEETKVEAIKKFREYMGELAGETRHYSESGLLIRTFEEEIRDDQAMGLIDKMLRPAEAKKNLVIIQSNPDTEEITKLLTELKIATYPKYLLDVSYGAGPTIEAIARFLKNADERTRNAFFLGNDKARLFLDQEIVAIKKEIERLETK